MCRDKVLVERELSAKLRYTAVGVFVVFVLTSMMASPPQAQQVFPDGPLAVTSEQPEALRDLASELDRQERFGSLRLTAVINDWLAEGHRHERLQQYHLDLPVVGGDITRHSFGRIETSVFGNVYRTERADTNARLRPDDISKQLLQTPETSLLRTPELKWLGIEGDTALVYEAFVLRASKPFVVYIDADTGLERMSVPLRHTQSAVGEGTGVLGDRKKLSTSGGTSGYRLDDLQRPPVLKTIDLRGSAVRKSQLFDSRGTVTVTDLAVDSDNVWTDPSVVDAHAYLGWTYDFLFKRMGFRGLNNNNAPMYVAVNLRQPNDCLNAAVDLDDCVNAFWENPPFGPEGRGGMFFGNGMPASPRFPSHDVLRMVGAIDIVAHELTHGVTYYTSKLVYLNESGALNEAFSDMMGTAVEAYYQPRGPRYQGADYVMGEDVFRPAQISARDGNRSMSNPATFGDPDHYGLRERIGTTQSDYNDTGVHSNSGIANHAYYLAIEGGTNRISGRSVAGVGFANREQIEKTFFRAFTMLLPSNATFFQARLATIQSARELYGFGSATERAVTQAWDAVGVTSAGAALRTRFSPNPVPPSSLSCEGARPSFSMTVSVSEFQGVAFNVSGFDAQTFDLSNRLLQAETFPASTFAAWFTDCGPGSTQIRAGSQACARLCTSLGGRTAGYSVFRFRGTDANGNVGTFLSDPVGLNAVFGATGNDTNTAFGPVTITKIP